MSNLKKHYNKYYDSSDFKLGLNPDEFIKKFNFRNIEFNNLKILDLGCGEGRHSFYFANKGSEVIGVDISEVAVQKGNIYAKSSKLNCKFYQNEILDFLKKDKNKYDIILCIDFFQYLNENLLNRILDLISQKLNRNGCLLISAFVFRDEIEFENALKKGYYFLNPIFLGRYLEQFEIKMNEVIEEKDKVDSSLTFNKQKLILQKK